MKKQRFIQVIITVLCAVFFACAGFAVSNYLEREDAVTARAATVTPTIYWGVTTNGTTLRIGSNTSAQSGCSIKDSFAGNALQNWQSKITDKTKITKIDVRSNIVPVTMSQWFYGFTNLTDISSLSNIDTSLCVNFQLTFQSCSSLTDLTPIKDWNVSSVNTFAQTFHGCSSLIDLTPLTDWDVNAVQTMVRAFEGCTSVTDFSPLKNWKMPFLNTIEYPFKDCSGNALEVIYEWDYTNCIDISGLFGGLVSATDIDTTRIKFDKSKVRFVLCMFDSCPSLKSVDVSGLIDTSMSVNDLTVMFYNCPLLESIKGLDTWDVSNITNFSSIFYASPSLRSLDLSNWNFDNATSIVNFFDISSSLEIIKFNDSFVDALNRISTQNARVPFPLHDAAGKTYNSVSDLTSGGTYFTSVAHTHVFSSAGTVTPPTCKDEGYTTKHCDNCGLDVKVDIVPADSGKHVWGNWVTFTAANCTADEVQKRTCTVCFNEETQTLTGTATGHAKGTHHDAVAATCSKTGNVEYWECANGCGKFIDDSLTELSTVTIPINPNAHSFTNYVSNNNATCADNATETADCANGCGQTDTREILGTAKGHKWATAWSKDATNHWHVCENGCGVKGGETAHVYNWVTDTPATLTTPGIKHEECLCGAKRNENTEIPIQTCAHANLTHYDRVEATCSVAGNIEYWHCADCNKNLDSVNTELPDITIPIDNTAHVFTNYVSDNNATCTVDGTKTAECDHGCGTKDTVTDTGTQLAHSFTNYVSNSDATCTADGTKTAQCDHGCGATDTVTDMGSMTQHTYEWVITKPATKDEAGLMQNKCTVCGDVAEEKEIAKLEDPNGGGEIDLPVDINVEFKVTQSSTDNEYSDLEGLKRGYWAQLWYRNEDGTLGDEFTDKINCFLTLKIPTEIIEAIRGGEEINRDKIAEGLTVYYYVDGQRYNVDNFAIAQRDDESWQIKFNYNAKFRAEVVFNAPDYKEQSPAAGIPWWVWLIVGLAGAAVVGVVIVIIVVAKKKSAAAVVADNGEVLGRLDKQDEKLNEIREIVDGGFNDIVDDE